MASFLFAWRTNKIKHAVVTHPFTIDDCLNGANEKKPEKAISAVTSSRSNRHQKWAFQGTNIFYEIVITTANETIASFLCMQPGIASNNNNNENQKQKTKKEKEQQWQLLRTKAEAKEEKKSQCTRKPQNDEKAESET